MSGTANSIMIVVLVARQRLSIGVNSNVSCRKWKLFLIVERRWHPPSSNYVSVKIKRSCNSNVMLNILPSQHR